jgi:CRISPR type IV-associated protein Csf2
MTISNRIEGVLRLTSPMHCAAIGEPGSTHKQNVITPNGTQRMPYFPANDLRGRLRRAAADIVLDHITSTRGKVDVNFYAALKAGAITTSPESDMTIEEALRGRDNVYMGLFGGGTRLLRSRFCANDLMPVVQDTISAGIVPAAFESYAPQGRTAEGKIGPLTGYHLAETRTSFRVDDVARVMEPGKMESYVSDAVQSVARKQAEILSGRADRKADKASLKAGELVATEVSGKKDLGNMMEIEYISRGTPLHCLIDLQNDTTDAHVGLMLLALQTMVRKQDLGGWIRAGFGRYDANLILTRNGQAYQVFADEKNGAEATLTGELHATFCKAAMDAIQTLSVESMMEFFTPRAADKDEKAEKKAAKKAQKKADEEVAA